MTQTFKEGKRVPVTVVKAGPCTVTQVKTKQKDGYNAVQLAYGEKKEKSTKKPLKGHLKKTKIKGLYPRFIREVPTPENSQIKLGDKIKLSDIFSPGDGLTVTATSKGKGFAGGMKRWGFKGGPRTHGQSDRQRSPGSIGQGTDPGRVWKGKKMAGRMGSDTKTIKGLKVLSLDEKTNEVSISGPIPGAPKSLVILTKTTKENSTKSKEANKNE